MVLIVSQHLTMGVEGGLGLGGGAFKCVSNYNSSIENVLGSVVRLCCLEQDEKVQALVRYLFRRRT